MLEGTDSKAYLRWPTTTVFGPLKLVICNVSIEVLFVVNEPVLTELAH